MKDMGKLMKQAQEMKSKMKKVQDELKKTLVTAKDRKEIVEVTVTGELECRSLKILKPETDQVKLEAALKEAVNDANSKAKGLATSRLSEISGGLNIPGLT